MASFGKKTANPGFRPGDHWFECPRCGFDIYASEAKREWTGQDVCPECFDPRHPQDLIRGIADSIAPRGPVSPPTPDTFISVTYTLNTSYEVHGSYAIAGVARAGSARAGKGAINKDSLIPTATFGGVSGV